MTLTALFWGIVIAAGIIFALFTFIVLAGLMVIINVLPERRGGHAAKNDRYQ